MKSSEKTKRKKILNQLLFPMLLAIGMMAAAILAVVGIIFYNTYQNQVTGGNLSENELMANNVAAFMSEAYALSEELANDPDILTMETDVQTPVLAACVERNPYLELLYIQDSTGMQTGRSTGELADRSARWWFQQVLADKESFVSKSYYSVNTGMPCASIFFPMYRGKEFVGVFATDIKLDSLVSMVSEYSDRDNDKTVFIIDGEGNVVAHPDSTYIEELYNYSTYTKTVSVKDEDGKVMTDEDGNILTEEVAIHYSNSFKKMISDVIAGNSGNSIVEMNGSSYYAAYSPIIMDGTSDSWSVVTVQKRGTVMSTVYMVIGITILISVIVLAVAAVMIVMMARRITNPILELIRIIGIASEGDFSVKAGTNSKTEIGMLAESFNNMTDKVSMVLNETIGLIEEVKGSAKNFSSISKKSENVVIDMENISEGAVNQYLDIQKVVELTGRLNECQEELDSMSSQLIGKIRGTKELSNEGIRNVTELKRKSEENLCKVQSSYEKVLELNESSKKIETIIKEINDISSQTDLLALNASIEAAKAGEQGRGFAVVADEVAALAANSVEATGNIESIVRNLQHEIEDIVTEIDAIKEVFNEQIEAVELVEKSFVHCDASSEESLATVEQVGKLINNVDGISHEVVQSVNSIHEISRQTEENAKEVSERMMEQKDEIHEIAQIVDNMNAASDMIEKDMSKFKLK